jgi:hypothetical protein
VSDVLVEYSDVGGSTNTDRTLEKAKIRGHELGIDSFVIATSRGVVGLQAAKYLQGKNVIIVRHVTGFKDPNVQEMPDDVRESILQLGARVVTAAHAFGGFGRGIRKRFNTFQVDEIVAETLRVFGAGLKVAIEISAMAVDAGLVRTDKDIIAVGGGGGGADTAIVVQPSNIHTFFETKVREIICKPRAWG